MIDQPFNYDNLLLGYYFSIILVVYSLLQLNKIEFGKNRPILTKKFVLYYLSGLIPMINILVLIILSIIIYRHHKENTHGNSTNLTHHRRANGSAT